jgi:hypothetical protein
MATIELIGVGVVYSDGIRALEHVDSFQVSSAATTIFMVLLSSPR